MPEERGPVTQPRTDIVAFVDEGLGHSSYVIALGDGSALVVDPARFPDRQRELAAARGWTVRWTADTHSHADYVSGSPELAAGGATFLASRAARLEVAHRAVAAGETVDVAAGAELRAIPTPGHTPDHLAYLFVVDDQPEALFSGGSLMVGALGRTDLLGDEHREELARSLFRALRTEILTLPDDLAVYPTHGAGSFCSAPAGAARTTTIGIEKVTNPLLAIDDEDRFVAELLAGLGTFPGYFRQLPERNRRGPRLYPSVPELARLDVADVQARIAAGAALVDARSIEAFAAGHVPGSLSIQQRPAFASWLGWLIDLDRSIVFVLDDTSDRDKLVRQSMTVGHEHIIGELAGGIESWIAAGLPVETTDLVGPTEATSTLLDVRQDPEWVAGHVPGSVHIELAAVVAADVPEGPVMVLCGHGERAMTGASLLQAAGRAEVSVLVGGPSELAAAIGAELETG